jgi:predicted transcriptional regulator
MAKAIITNTRRADLTAYAMDIARRADAGETLPEADYVLNFENPVDAYRAVTPERFRLLQVLQSAGPLTVHALAQRLDRHYSNVHADVAALLDLGLLERTERGVRVPWDAVEWRLSTVPQAA